MEPLLVYLHGEHIGTIEEGLDRRGPAFAYAEHYRNRSDAMALGRKFPLAGKVVDSPTLLRWLDGLLPEGERRAALARQLGLHRMSTLGLIREVGGDCAGAVQIVAPGREQAKARYETASRAEIGNALEELASRPLRAFERGARLSIAGAQEKLVLARTAGGAWGWPLGGTASTHILKPQGARFPGLVRNEALCMTLAREAGLAAAEVAVEDFAGIETLVVRRYDRDARGRRIHQEDFAQALGARAKYQRDGGPALRDCFERSGVGGWDMWDQAMFAWLIGDEDKHAKNWSVLYERRKAPRLAPIYDAVCTLAYPGLERGMAMRIGRCYQVHGVDEKALRAEARRCGLEPEEAVRRTHALAERVRDALVGLRERGWDTSVLDRTATFDRCQRAFKWTRSGS